MARVLVSILSKHTMPNYLFIKEMEGQYDDLLFITTEEVNSGKGGESLEEALNLPWCKAAYISVDGNDYHAAINELGENEDNRDNEYIVNLTGGTKIMSLAVHDYFLQRENSQFFYVPIGKNIYYNLKTGETKPLNHRATLSEYFTLYGIRFEHTREEDFGHTEEEARGIFEEVKQNKYFLSWRLKNAHQAETPELKKYLSGEWFEQFSYYKLKEVFGLNESEIALSLKIYRGRNQPANDNELDIAYMYENQLHVVECKVSMVGYGKDVKDVIEEYLYKLAAISKDFGLQVKSYLFTLHKMRKIPPEKRHNFSKRCRILGIEGIVSENMFENLKSSLYNRQALQP